jgi:hypothetical protein
MHRSRELLSILALALLFALACNKPSDDNIATEIKAKMFSEPLLKTSTINVSVKGGTVTLSGQLTDDAARLAAERIAKATKGVSIVVDQTSVPILPAAAEYVPTPAPAPAPVPPTSHRRRASRPQAATSPSSPPPTTSSSPAPEASPAEAAPSSAPTPAAAPAPPPPPPTPPPPQPVTAAIQAGTVVTVRTIDNIDSSTSRSGQTFRASLDAPVLIDGHVVLPKGLNVNLKIVAASSAGKFSGASELTVALDSLTYQGKTYYLSSSSVQEKGDSRGKRSAAVITGGSVLGAIIGGLAGGGKGAAIGAAAGAGGGAAVQASTKGKQVRIAPETHLDFTLRDPLDVTYIPRKNSSRSTANPPPTTDQPASTETQQPQ